MKKIPRMNRIGQLRSYFTAKNTTRRTKRTPSISQGPKVPVLEDIFKPPKDPAFRYVTKDTPIASSPREIRGVFAPFIQHIFQGRQIHTTPKAYNCEYFTAYYFPPWHYISWGRKSRPALVSLFEPGQQYNGADLSKIPYKVIAQTRSKNPMDYAYWRNYITKSLSKQLYNGFHNVPNSVDGTFLVRSKKVAEDDKVLELHVTRMLKKAAEMANSEQTWIKTANNKFSQGLSKFNQLLVQRHIAPLKIPNQFLEADWRAEPKPTRQKKEEAKVGRG